MNSPLTPEQIDLVLEQFDQTRPSIQREIVASLLTEVKQARPVLARMPRSADLQPLVPGDPVWVMILGKDGTKQHVMPATFLGLNDRAGRFRCFLDKVQVFPSWIVWKDRNQALQAIP